MSRTHSVLTKPRSHHGCQGGTQNGCQIVLKLLKKKVTYLEPKGKETLFKVPDLSGFGPIQPFLGHPDSPGSDSGGLYLNSRSLK